MRSPESVRVAVVLGSRLGFAATYGGPRDDDGNFYLSVTKREEFHYQPGAKRGHEDPQGRFIVSGKLDGDIAVDWTVTVDREAAFRCIQAWVASLALRLKGSLGTHLQTLCSQKNEAMRAIHSASANELAGDPSSTLEIDQTLADLECYAHDSYRWLGRRDPGFLSETLPCSLRQPCQ